jgi:hypothetical protein
MLHIHTSHGKPMQLPRTAFTTHIASAISGWTSGYAAAILRALILLLVGLLMLLIGVVFFTAQYGSGVLVLGSILLVGFGAAQFDRKR